MSETMNLIEEYREIAAQHAARAARAEATLIAVVRYAAGDSASIVIPNALLAGLEQWGVEPASLKKGLKLTLKPVKEDD